MLTHLLPCVSPTQIEADPEVWCQLIYLAGRANRPDLASVYFNACIASGCEPNQHIYNAMMAALAKICDVDQVSWRSGHMAHCLILHDIMACCYATVHGWGMAWL